MNLADFVAELAKLEVEVSEARSRAASLNTMSSQMADLLITQDVQHDLRESLHSPYADFGRNAKWLDSKHSERWKQIFSNDLKSLGHENQIKALDHLHIFPGYSNDKDHSKEEYLEFLQWKQSLLTRILENKDFPKNLFPLWTKTALRFEFDGQSILNWVEKSIGVIRGRLHEHRSSEDCDFLYKFLMKTNASDPSKSLKHRLMLMRVSPKPLTDHTLSKLSGQSDHDEWNTEWYDLMFDYVKHARYRTTQSTSYKTLEEEKERDAEDLMNLSKAFANFCLSRLKVKRGQTIDADNKPDNNKFVEPSPIWRQGYAKALMELHLDLGGSCHKTLNFLKRHDPDEDVRAITGECYKSLRRQSSSKRSSKELKQALIAAEWWLQLCHRRELGLQIDYREARNTRRKMLRSIF